MGVRTGHVLADRYELGERLGRGGMGVVYAARDVRLGRRVAVKVLDEGFATDPAFHRRFEREARTAASLSHPNVVAVYDRGEQDGAPYIVMELIDGPSLEDVVRRDGRLDPGRAVAIARDVARALGAAHAIGLVHRDVKPSNVLLTRGGQVKVADFGIARGAIDTTLTEGGQVLGSVPYVAPEQVTGGEVTPATDVYALGCVLHTLLTGSPPFTGDSHAAVIHQHVNAPPPALDGRAGRLPAGLDEVVGRALAKDPRERYRDGRQLAEVLGVVLAAGSGPSGTQVLPLPADLEQTQVVGEPADGRPAARPRRRRWRRRVAALALLLGALAAATILGSDPEAEPPAQEPAAPQPEPEPEPEPEPPEPEPEPESVGDILDELGGLVTAEPGGALNPGAARNLTEKLAKVVEEYADGEPGKALDKLDELRREVLDRARTGQLDAGRAEALLAAVARLESALLKVAVVEGDGDGGGGEGRGDGDRDDDGDD